MQVQRAPCRGFYGTPLTSLYGALMGLKGGPIWAPARHQMDSTEKAAGHAMGVTHLLHGKPSSASKGMTEPKSLPATQWA